MVTATAAPRERPILMRGHLVREALADRKTQTRRIVKPQPPSVEAVYKKAGIGFSIFNTGRMHNRRGEPLWSVAGPVWAVRELMGGEAPDSVHWRCPYGSPGDRLWVKETHAVMNRDRTTAVTHGPPQRGFEYVYRADEDHGHRAWRPSIHMPRRASRLLLEVVSVHVERLQDISEEDAKLEGVEPVELTRKVYPSRLAADVVERSYREGFAKVWREINGAKSRDENPFVWAIAFRRVA